MKIDFGEYRTLGFSAKPLTDNTDYTWTLTTYLGKFLRCLEKRYGQRDQTYTPLGIEFYGDIPQVWYPGNCKHMSIMLTSSAMLNPRQALFQLAHEAVHILAPTGGKNAPVIEEGLATLFQMEISDKYELDFSVESEPYKEASDITEKLLSGDSYIIRTLRETKPCFSHWTPDFIRPYVNEDVHNLLGPLCSKFNRGD